MPPRLSFRHIYFSPDSRGASAQADAEAMLTTLEGQLQDLPDGLVAADRFMFQDYYGERTLQAIAREFGPQFTQDIA